MSVFAELDTALQALLALKAPGVTKSRIASITTLCVENVKSESTLVQKIYTHFRRAPATHKLGVLYVIDAVTRQWIDKAGSTGPEIAASSPQDGTFAAGVQKIAELLPQMMTDLISNAPYDQKEKITKLVDIWERGNIFPSTMTADFKSKLDARNPDAGDQQEQPKVAEPTTATSSQTNVPTVATSVQGPSDLLSNLTGPQSLPAPHAPTIQAPNGAAPAYPQQTPTAPLPAGAAPPQMMQQTAPTVTPDQLAQLSSVIPPHIASDPVALQKHISLLQQLVQLNVPPEQWPAVIEAMHGQGSASTQQQPPRPQQTSYNSPARNRSRSPTRGRNSPNYGDYRGNDGYRQRSPGRSNTPSMQADMTPLGEPKWTTMDPSLPEGHIRVLSRTLFVGGTTCGEAELRHIFEGFGQVQTCIPNAEKRHAFVKYTNRAGAETARDAMQNIQDPTLQNLIRSVRWGVGFGPRDCNDYQSGVSVIPIERLTDADRKWVLTAPHGGSGGKPIESGLVMEEPDIEIGAGVSSKAISRRVGGQETFRNANGRDYHANRSRGGNNGGRGGYGSNRRSSPNMTQPNPMPQMGYQPNMQPMGMPQYGMPPQQQFYGLPPGQGPMHYG